MSCNYTKGWAGPLDDIIFMTPAYISVFSFFVSIFTHETKIEFSASDVSRILLLSFTASWTFSVPS